MKRAISVRSLGLEPSYRAESPKIVRAKRTLNPLVERETLPPLLTACPYLKASRAVNSLLLANGSSRTAPTIPAAISALSLQSDSSLRWDSKYDLIAVPGGMYASQIVVNGQDLFRVEGRPKVKSTQDIGTDPMGCESTELSTQTIASSISTGSASSALNGDFSVSDLSVVTGSVENKAAHSKNNLLSDSLHWDFGSLEGLFPKPFNRYEKPVEPTFEKLKDKIEHGQVNGLKNRFYFSGKKDQCIFNKLPVDGQEQNTLYLTEACDYKPAIKIKQCSLPTAIRDGRFSLLTDEDLVAELQLDAAFQPRTPSLMIQLKNKARRFMARFDCSNYSKMEITNIILRAVAIAMCVPQEELKIEALLLSRHERLLRRSHNQFLNEGGIAWNAQKPTYLAAIKENLGRLFSPIYLERRLSPWKYKGRVSVGRRFRK